MTAESILVNFVYCHPVGHAVEALQACLGYRSADPGRRIGLVLNAATAVELADFCAAVDEIYPVELDVFDPDSAAGALAGVPRDWDWVVDEPRGHQPGQREFFPGLAAYYDAAARHFRARLGHHQVAEPRPAYQPGNRLELDLPAAAEDWAAGLLPGDAATIGILPGGSASRWRYPSLASWRRILAGLTGRAPHARFCLFGKLAADGRTTTGFTRAEYDKLARTVPGAAWALDVGLARQLAALRRCTLLLSPHTGFGFTALAVGTPWLVLGGNDWAEYYYNPGVPFYSVLPDIARYPCYLMLGNRSGPVTDDGPRSPSMCAARIEEDLGELLDAADWLLGGDADFDTAMRGHVRRAYELFGGRTDLMFSVDDLHVPYLPVR